MTLIPATANWDRDRDREEEYIHRRYPDIIRPVTSFKFRRLFGQDITGSQIWPVDSEFLCSRLEVNDHVLRDTRLIFYRMPGHLPSSWRISFEGRYSGTRFRAQGEVVIFDDELRVVRFA